MGILDETYTLSNRVTIPALGLGTWFIDDDDAAQAVRTAIALGYRQIDTAQAYGNERGVGEGLRTADVAREDIFVTSKLAAEIKDHDSAVAAIRESLERMGLEYLDLMLIHAPQPWNDYRGGDYSEGNRQAWRALEEAHAEGTLRAIGVSNFLRADLENIIAGATVQPHVLQTLVHAGNTPRGLLEFCRARKILVQAHSPIAHGEIFGNEMVEVLAEKYGVTVPQLCIRYVIQLGTVALPKTANPEHMRQNADLEFEIDEDDMEALEELDARDYGDSSRFPVYGRG